MLGEGAFGTVCADSKGQAALKEFRDPPNNAFYCLGEAAILNFLKGVPFVVQINGLLGVDHGIPTGISLGIHGESIEDIGIESHNLPTNKIVFQIVHAIAHIHSLGVAHRDMSAANVLWNGTTIAICDFGSACFLDIIPATKMSLTSGTCRSVYLSPLLQDKEDLTQTDTIHCDLYAIGVFITQLTNRCYFIDNSRIKNQRLAKVVQVLQTHGSSATDVLAEDFFQYKPPFVPCRESPRKTIIPVAPLGFSYSLAKWLKNTATPEDRWDARKATCLGTAINMYQAVGDAPTCAYLAYVLVMRETIESDLDKFASRLDNVTRKFIGNMGEYVPIITDDIDWCDDLIQLNFFPNHEIE